MDQTKQIVALGEEARQFKNSLLWDYIISKSDQAIEAATKELLTIDPSDSKGVARAQNNVSKYSDFSSWLEELILAGDAAYEEYLISEE